MARRIVGPWCAAILLLAASCSDSSANEGDGAGTGSTLQNRDGGSAGAGTGSDAGSGARAGSNGSAGRRAPEAGSGGMKAQGGSRALAGSGGAGAGTSGSSAGASGATAGSDGAAGTMEISDACATDTDCEMCTEPLGPEENCCAGCPTPHSKQRCAAVREAAKMCVAAKRPAPQIPVCPALLCIEPGEALCENGMCVRGNGTR